MVSAGAPDELESREAEAGVRYGRGEIPVRVCPVCVPAPPGVFLPAHVFQFKSP